jgi:hypothetical protein
MNKMMKRAALLAIVFIVSLPLGLAGQDEGYNPNSFARLSYVNGAVYVERTSGLGYEKGEVNLALVQGDRIGTESGQVEIQFGRRNYLRLGDNTKVEFALLPSAGEERIKLHLTVGSAYLRVSELAVDKGIEVDTPDASFYVLDQGLYRIDVGPSGETRVYVSEGSLEAAAEDGSVLVRAQETLTASDGRLLGDPEYGSPSGDALDDWNGSRDAQLAERSGRQYLPTDMVEYEEELDQNGSWVYERPYGNVWVPDVSYYDDWRPYYYGRWVWYPLCGWTWVPSESWGWSVYHYGRWNWRFGLGWYWIPQNHWGPAWVHWWSDHDHVGWCPLTWYNRPAYLFHDRFYDRYDDRYYSAHNRAMTVVRRDHLQSPDVGRHHLGESDLDRIGRVELKDRQPGIRPQVDNARPQAIAARRALADRPGGRNEVKSLAPSRDLASPHPRQGGNDAGVGSRGRQSSGPEANRNALARPSSFGDGSNGRTVRIYPSQGAPGHRAEGANTVSRGGDNSAGRSSESRVSRSQGRDSGSSRSSTVREPSRDRTSGRESGSSVTRRSDPAKSDPPASRGGGSAVKGERSTSTAGSVRSGGERSSGPSSSGRSQSRSYASRSTISRPASRVTSGPSYGSRPAAPVSRPSSFAGSSSSSRSGSRSGSVRAPSASSSRSSMSAPSRASSTSFSRTRSSAPSSSRPSGSSGRSFSASRPAGGSSGRSYNAPRSGGSSAGRSSGAVRSGGSSPSGRSASSSSSRSGSSSSRSSSSPSRSGGHKTKG